MNEMNNQNMYDQNMNNQDMYHQSMPGQDHWQNPWDDKRQRRGSKGNRGIIITVSALCMLLLFGGIGLGAYLLGRNSIPVNQENAQTQWGNGKGTVPDFGGDMSGGQRMPGGMDFSQFVENGIIDQATADKMQAYMEEQMQGLMENGQNGGRAGGTDLFSGLFDSMVEEGILTQEQADEIQDSMPQPGSGNMPGGFGNEVT